MVGVHASAVGAHGAPPRRSASMSVNVWARPTRSPNRHYRQDQCQHCSSVNATRAVTHSWRVSHARNRPRARGWGSSGAAAGDGWRASRSVGLTMTEGDFRSANGAITRQAAFEGRRSTPQPRIRVRCSRRQRRLWCATRFRSKRCSTSWCPTSSSILPPASEALGTTGSTRPSSTSTTS